MKTGISRISSGITVAVVVGMLIAATAGVFGNGAQIRVTHSDTVYRGTARVAANAQASTAEVQIAVLAKAPSQPTVPRLLHVHR
jgi:hypothetical protein